MSVARVTEISARSERSFQDAMNSKAAAKNGIESVQKNAAGAKVDDETGE